MVSALRVCVCVCVCVFVCVCTSFVQLKRRIFRPRLVEGSLGHSTERTVALRKHHHLIVLNLGIHKLLRHFRCRERERGREGEREREREGGREGGEIPTVSTHHCQICYTVRSM